MRKILYSKYTNDRLPEYQTETIIFLEDNIKKVQKRPLTKSGENHIKNIINNYTDLSSLNPNEKIKLIDLNIQENDYKIVFNFAQGKSYNVLLVEALKKDKNECIRLLKDYREIFFSFKNKEFKHFNSDKAFFEVFGINLNLSDIKCIKPANIDLIPMNMFVKDDQITIIDYEWCMDFYVPINFILFRSLLDFYCKNREIISGSFNLKDLFNIYKLSKKRIRGKIARYGQ